MRSLENSSSTEESSEDYGEEVFEFDWILPDFLNEKRDRIDSEIFEGKTKWQLIFFPRGFNVEDISVFLKCCDTTSKWERHLSFTVTLVHPTDPKKSFVKSATDHFTAEIPDRGFAQMTDGKDDLVRDPSCGYLIDGEDLKIRIKLEVIEYTGKQNPEHSYYGSAKTSKERTGYVGLENQGATCYLSSFLQSLYHIPYLRKAVYQMNTSQDSSDSPTIILALQRLFYRLQFENDAVDTKELTKSFGWESGEVFTQHDAQELSRLFIDALETKMKGTKLDGMIAKMYRGTELSIIKCLNVDYSSSVKQTFYDLSLNVKGCASAVDSFRQYCEDEMLVGSDQYDAGEKFGKQDAKKCVRFGELPPVLQLHLKRFELRQTRFGYQHVKVNDYFKFPTKLHLEEFMESSDSSVRQTYYLHGVLVHAGGVNSGHYFAFIRPGLSKKWYKFDDETVMEVPREEAIASNFGGVGRYGHEKSANAYMLIYVRKKDRHMYLEPCTEADIPPELMERFRRDKEEKERKIREREEQRWLINLDLIFDNDIIGNTVHDLCTESIKSIKVRKDYKFDSIHGIIEKEYGIPADKQRIWKWIRRQNKTLRPNSRPIPPHKADKRILDFRTLKTLYVEEVADAAEPYPADSCLIFLKLYDPAAPAPLKVIGKLHSQKSATLSFLADHVRELCQFSPEDELEVWEEVHLKNIAANKMASTLDAAKLRSGDILVFQKKLPEAESEAFKYPTVPSYFSFLSKRIAVTFRPRNPTAGLEDFVLGISEEDTFPDVLQILAKRLNTEEKFIRLSRESYYQGYEVIDPKTPASVKSLLNVRCIFVYDILNVDVSTIINKREVIVSFRTQNLKIGNPISLFVSKTASVQEVLDAYKATSEVSYETQGKELQLVGLRSNKIHACLKPESLFPPAVHNVEWIIEEIPDEELNEGDKDITAVIGICQKRETYYGHDFKWLPSAFTFTFKHDETAAEAKKRLEQRLQLPKAEFDRLILIGFQSNTYGSDKALKVADDFCVAKGLRNHQMDYLALCSDAPKRSNELKIEAK